MPGQARRPARKTGLEAPFSANQKKAWVLQSSCTALFWGLAASFLASVPAEGLPANSGGPTAWLVAALTAHGVLVLVGATTWWWLSHHNPLEPGFRRLLPDSPRWSKQQYCAVHKAKIEGLDHHCTWLNVSVGRSNYVPFMLLTATGGAQFTVQFVVGALLLCDGGAGTFDGAAARARLGGDGPFAAWAAFLGRVAVVFVAVSVTTAGRVGLSCFSLWRARVARPDPLARDAVKNAYWPLFYGQAGASSQAAEARYRYGTSYLGGRAQGLEPLFRPTH